MKQPPLTIVGSPPTARRPTGEPDASRSGSGFPEGAEKKASEAKGGKVASSGNPEPVSLGAAGLAAWQSIMDEYGITDAGGLMLLRQVAETIDEIADNAVAIKRDGRLITVDGIQKEHPLLRNQVALRSFLTRSLQRLGLNLEPVKPPGRPPGWSA